MVWYVQYVNSIWPALYQVFCTCHKFKDGTKKVSLRKYIFDIYIVLQVQH